MPRRAAWARMAMAELNRIHSHLVWLGTSALELGAISLFWYCFDDRDQILDLFEMAGGTRMHTRYFQVGGLAEDLPPGFTAEARKFCEAMPKSVDEYEAILDRNAIWLERTKGVGLLSADDALALGQSGPDAARSTGVDWDLRKDMPYLAYDEVEFDVPVYGGGRRLRPLPACTWTRCASPCASSASASTGSTRCDGEPWIADDRKVVLPPRHELHTSMESLIHHFKIVTEGFTVPEGEVYVAIESPRGENGCYLVSDGGAEAVARQVPRPELRRAAGDGDDRARRLRSPT